MKISNNFKHLNPAFGLLVLGACGDSSTPPAKFVPPTVNLASYEPQSLATKLPDPNWRTKTDSDSLKRAEKDLNYRAVLAAGACFVEDVKLAKADGADLNAPSFFQVSSAKASLYIKNSYRIESNIEALHQIETTNSGGVYSARILPLIAAIEAGCEDSVLKEIVDLGANADLNNRSNPAFNWTSPTAVAPVAGVAGPRSIAASNYWVPGFDIFAVAATYGRTSFIISNIEKSNWDIKANGFRGLLAKIKANPNNPLHLAAISGQTQVLDYFKTELKSDLTVSIPHDGSNRMNLARAEDYSFFLGDGLSHPKTLKYAIENLGLAEIFEILGSQPEELLGYGRKLFRVRNALNPEISLALILITRDLMPSQPILTVGLMSIAGQEYFGENVGVSDTYKKFFTDQRILPQKNSFLLGAILSNDDVEMARAALQLGLDIEKETPIFDFKNKKLVEDKTPFEFVTDHPARTDSIYNLFVLKKMPR